MPGNITAGVVAGFVAGEFGQVLIHELTHVWQIEHTHSTLNFLCEAIPIQLSDELFSVPLDNRPWGEYNLEQQAAIVELWYSGFSGDFPPPCSVNNPFYHYVLNNINGDIPPPTVQTLSVRDITKSKFGEDGGFSVRTLFPLPLQTSASLRGRLIGLKG